MSVTSTDPRAPKPRTPHGVTDVRDNMLDATGAELETVREFLGLTTMAFAQLVGASYRAVRAWESGERQIPSRIRRQLRELESRTVQTVGAVVAELNSTKDRTVVVYATDAELHAARPETAPLTARWWRHVVARARLEVPGTTVVTPADLRARQRRGRGQDSPVQVKSLVSRALALPPPRRWYMLADAVAAHRAQTGRWPSKHATDTDIARLGRWLHDQRAAASNPRRPGRWGPERRAYLDDVAPGWDARSDPGGHVGEAHQDEAQEPRRSA